MKYVLGLLLLALFQETCAKGFHNKSAAKQAIKGLSVHDLAKGIFQQCQTVPSQPLCDQQCLEDLQVNLFIERNSRALTVLGNFGLQQLLQPTADLALVNSRQQAIKSIVEEAFLQQQIAQQLVKAEAGLKSLIEYWQPEISPLHVLIQRYYFRLFISRWLNKSANTLELTNVMDLGIAAFTIAKQIVGEGSARYVTERLAAYNVAAEQRVAQRPLYYAPFDMARYGLEAIKSNHSWKDGPEITQEQIADLKNNFSLTKLVELANIRMQQTAKGDYQFYKDICHFPTPIAATVTFSAIAIADYSRLYVINNAARYVYEQFKQTTELQHNLVMVAQVLRTAHKLLQILNENLVTPINAQKTLHNFFANAQYDDEMAELLNLVDSATFNSKAQLPNFRRGVVLRLHKLVQKNKEKLVPIILAIAEIDSLYSMSALFKERQQQDVPMSFVEFLAAPMPVIRLQEVWVPLLRPEQAVTNDIFMGNGLPSIIILTGPNGAGKSTIMKAVAYSILLAQSVGLVPAKQGAQLTPFATIMTYKSPEEMIAQNKSTFMAQKERAQQLESAVNVQTDAAKMAVFVDEPFSGTLEAEAAKRCENLAMRIGKHANVVGIFATHFERPTRLENQFPAIFANYQLELLHRENHFRRTFKLLPGVALWWFHDEAMREAFIDQLA